MGNSDSHKNQLIDSKVNKESGYEYIHELETKAQLGFEGYRKFKKSFNILVFIIIIFHIGILICEYYFGGYKTKNETKDDINLNNLYYNISNSLHQNNFISLNYDIKSYYCFDVQPCFDAPLDGILIKKSISSTPNLDYSKVCKSNNKINFNTKQMNKDKIKYVTCNGGYVIEGNECPKIDSYILNNTNIIRDEYMVNLCIKNDKLEARYKIPLKKACLEKLNSNMYFYTMNEYLGSYVIYTIFHLFLVILEIHSLIFLNQKQKYVETSRDVFEKKTTTNYTEHIRVNGVVSDIDRKHVNVETFEKAYYIVKQQTFHDKLYTMRLITFTIFIFAIFMVMNISIQKVMPYKKTFESINMLYTNDCFYEEIYNSNFQSFYQNNFSEFYFFYYYRMIVNYISLGCCLFVVYIDTRFFTFKEFFQNCDSKRVSTEEALNHGKGFDY